MIQILKNLKINYNFDDFFFRFFPYFKKSENKLLFLKINTLKNLEINYNFEGFLIFFSHILKNLKINYNFEGFFTAVL